MSQIYKTLTSSGPIPPNIPTSFTTQNGTATPAANILIINGFDSTENNDNGIITKGGVVGTGTSNEVDVVITNRIQGAVTTADATPTTIITFPLTAIGNYAFDINISAYNTTDTTGASYSLFVGVKSVGGVATKLNLEDKIVNEEITMIPCNTSITASGNSVLVQVTGIAAKSINWNAVGTYVYVG